MTYKHGMTETSTYRCWDNMKQRCLNPNHKSYKNYGERGIQICEEWHDFRNFYNDMGERPDSLTIERVDNNGDYELGNCKWATYKEQNNNHRPHKAVSCGSAKQRWFIALCPTGEYFLSNNQHTFAQQHGLTRGRISGCLCGRNKAHKGWIFQRI